MKLEAATLLKAVSVSLFLCSVIGGPASAVNTPPVAVCQDVEVNTETGVCWAEVDIDNGSYDPNGDPFTLEQNPPGPYDLGTTEVTLTVTDDGGLSDICTAVVTVIDVEAPVISCNGPTHSFLSHRAAPISFTADAFDNCAVAGVEILDYECIWTNPQGKSFDRTDRCPVSIDEVDVDTINLGTPLIPFTLIRWPTEATDLSGNEFEEVCFLQVVVRTGDLKP